jgi:hypothetical protein
MSTGRAVVAAAAVALLVLIVAEASARALKPAFTRQAPPPEEVRNPRFVRGWPEYTTAPAAPRPPGQKLIVAISNSQGFLREREDGREAWPSRLEAELRASGTDARVLNWSLPGGSGAEMTILAARSLPQRPDLIVLVSYNNNFGKYWRVQPLSFHHTDAGQLVYQASVRQYLPSDFLSELAATDPLEFLGAHSGLVWWRNYSWQPRTAWTFNSREPDPEELGPEVSIKIAAITKFPLLDDFIQVVEQGEPPPQVIIVSMPLCRSRCHNWESVGAFYERAVELAAQHRGVTALDATNLLEEDLFYGPRHFSSGGHRIFAAWLTPEVQRALAAPR